MAYTTYEFYTGTYLGNSVAGSQFPFLEARASDIIDAATGYVLQRVDLSTLPQLTQALVQKAVCAEVDYLGTYGDMVSVDGVAATDFTVGKVHVSSGNKSPMGMLAKGAVMYLEQTGLMQCAVPVVGTPFAPFPFPIK